MTRQHCSAYIFSKYCFSYIRSRLDRSYGSSNYLSNLHIVFHSGYTNLHSHQQCTQILFSPHPHLNTCYFLSFLIIAILTGVRPALSWYQNQTEAEELQKRKLEANIPDEPRCKYSQQIIGKSNSVIHKKDHLSQSGGLYSRNARTVQYPQINQHNITH